MFTAHIKTAFQHSYTMAVAHLYTAVGVGLTAWDGANVYFGSADFTPLSTRAMDYAHVPSDMRGMVLTGFVGFSGLIIAQLRRITTQPLPGYAVTSPLTVATDGTLAPIVTPPAAPKV